MVMEATARLSLAKKFHALQHLSAKSASLSKTVMASSFLRTCSETFTMGLSRGIGRQLEHGDTGWQLMTRSTPAK